MYVQKVAQQGGGDKNSDFDVCMAHLFVAQLKKKGGGHFCVTLIFFFVIVENVNKLPFCKNMYSEVYTGISTWFMSNIPGTHAEGLLRIQVMV